MRPLRVWLGRSVATQASRGAFAILLTLVVFPAVADKAANSIRYASTQVPANVDPYFNNLVLGTALNASIWDTLIYRNPATGAFEPNLATAWRWTDERTLDVDLRPGVLFHNGEPFGADDVAYTLTFIANPANKALTLASLQQWLERVEKLDNHHVRIHTKSPYPLAISDLAGAAMHPHRYYAEVGPSGMNERPIGTGPFRVVRHARGESITLERNPSYFSGPKAAPRIEQVEIRLVSDPTTQVAEIVAGRLDLIVGVAHDQAQQLRDIPRLQVIAKESGVVAFIALNTLPTTPTQALRDIRVRRAIAHAIDRETIARFLQGPESLMVDTKCYRLQFGCTDAGAPRYEYDPRKARELLAEAGYPEGFALDLFAYNGRNEVEAIANYLLAVGIEARLRFGQTTAVLTAVEAGRASALFAARAMGLVDVGAVLPLEHAFQRLDMNRDPDIRDLLQHANSVLDDTERRASLGRALVLISERAYSIPLYALAQHSVAAKDLVFSQHADNIPRFYEMYYR